MVLVMLYALTITVPICVVPICDVNCDVVGQKNVWNFLACMDWRLLAPTGLVVAILSLCLVASDTSSEKGPSNKSIHSLDYCHTLLQWPNSYLQ